MRGARATIAASSPQGCVVVTKQPEDYCGKRDPAALGNARF